MLFALCWAALASAAPLQDVLSSELERALAAYGEQPEKPHYIALQVETRDEWVAAARSGTVARQGSDRYRYLDVDMRVGTPELDSTHQLRGLSAWEEDSRGIVRLPIDDSAEYAIRRTIWRELDGRYRDAAERIVMIRANQRVKVEEESPAPDFSPRASTPSATGAAPELAVDVEAWGDLLAEVSARLDDSDVVHQSSAELNASRVEKVFVDSEGARIVHGGTHLRVSLTVQTTAADGDVVHVFEAWDTHTPEKLPSRDELLAKADWMVDRIEGLREAPRGQPFSGPVVLAGRASAVFFHEVFGHRVEGHRQKDAYEGKTFAEHVGKPILPDWVDVYDDPSLPLLAETDLNGFYRFDDEGTPAQRATLVEAGVFRGFLMGRSPIPGFEATNGHGRRAAGQAPVPRMANTIVDVKQTVPDAELKEMLRAEAKAQGLDYGVLVEEIDGGFTMTGRTTPNAFNVRASASWKVYADGRPDELLRGIDLVGTPFVAFKNLVAAGQEVQVFNGHCGAESGWVPVSGVAPSMLFRSLEFQLKEKGQERPPLLAKPDRGGDGAAEVAP